MMETMTPPQVGMRLQTKKIKIKRGQKKRGPKKQKKKRKEAIKKREGPNKKIKKM